LLPALLSAKLRAASVGTEMSDGTNFKETLGNADSTFVGAFVIYWYKFNFMWKGK
jgi:hypothetical protein